MIKLGFKAQEHSYVLTLCIQMKDILKLHNLKSMKPKLDLKLEKLLKRNTMILMVTDTDMLMETTIMTSHTLKLDKINPYIHEQTERERDKILLKK